MVTSLLRDRADLDQSARHPGGLLARALPLPQGWQRGISVPFYGCGEPILRDKCVNATDVPHKTTVAEFDSFPIEQGAVCSTNSGLDHDAHAVARLDLTTEWAMGRQLATDQIGNGSPSLADAEVLGTVANADFVTAVGCLEQAAADAGFGALWILHAPVRGASYLRDQKQLNNDGLSATGSRWVISPGYPMQSSTTVRLWATGTVWAGVDAPSTIGTTDWRVNTDQAFAMRAGLVAFDPCINIAIDVTVPACPVAP